MNHKLFSSILIFGIGAATMFAQYHLNPYLSGPSMKAQIGSIYYVGERRIKIDSNKILPITIAMVNNKITGPISMHFEETDDTDRYISVEPIPNGFEVLSLVPSEKVHIKPGYCRLFKANIKINSNKHQAIIVRLKDENDKSVYSFYLHINDPRFQHSDYKPFNESELCIFPLPPNTNYDDIPDPVKTMNNSVHVKTGSLYSIHSGHIKIESNTLLPISIAVKNKNVPNSFSLRVHEIDDTDRVRIGEYHPIINDIKPLTNGFKVVEINPKKPVNLQPLEIKLFRLSIKVNSDKPQIIRIDLIYDDDKPRHRLYLVINDPKYSNLEYIPFNESELCNFDPPKDPLEEGCQPVRFWPRGASKSY